MNEDRAQTSGQFHEELCYLATASSGIPSGWAKGATPPKSVSPHLRLAVAVSKQLEMEEDSREGTMLRRKSTEFAAGGGSSFGEPSGERPPHDPAFSFAASRAIVTAWLSWGISVHQRVRVHLAAVIPSNVWTKCLWPDRTVAAAFSLRVALDGRPTFDRPTICMGTALDLSRRRQERSYRTV